MNKKIWSLLLSILLLFSITGCSEEEVIEEEIPEYSFDIVGEQSDLGIPVADKDIFTKLENNTYYVKHNEVYYPIYFDESSSAMVDMLTYENLPADNRMLYYSTDLEKNIPTLYEGDTLIYYSTDTLLDYISWERFYDLKYTIGLTNLRKMISDRYYIDLSDSENYPLLSNGPLNDIALLDTEATSILIDKIGATNVNSNLVNHGIITGLTKDEVYDVEIYTGTFFQHYTAPANYHAFHSYELFASVNYETVQEYMYEIEIPSYFVDGYYNVNNSGMFRLVRGKSYNSDTDFNVQLLYPEISEYERETQQDIKPRCYSEYADINKFQTNVEGTLGYVDPEAEEVEDIDDMTDENGNPVRTIKKSVEKQFELWLPKNTVCKINVISDSDEKTGSIILNTEKQTKLAHFDYITNQYTLDVNGRGEKVTLTINGFYDGYEIQLTNAEIYNQQDITGDYTTNPELYDTTNVTYSSDSIEKGELTPIIIPEEPKEEELSFWEKLTYDMNENEKAAFMTLLIISAIGFVYSIFLSICLWKIYVKAGEHGFASLIPIYNLYIMSKIAFGKGWMFLLTCVPVVGSVFALILSFKFVKAFGKSTLFAILSIPFSFITIPMLAFGNCEYEG